MWARAVQSRDGAWAMAAVKEWKSWGWNCALGGQGGHTGTGWTEEGKIGGRRRIGFIWDFSLTSLAPDRMRNHG